MNVLVAQSGGPTSAINATISGIIDEARKNLKIQKIYGALNGIEGILKREVVNFTEMQINELKVTPSAILGSCRYKLSENFEDDIYINIIDFFREKNIKIFIYIGGNDSMDTVLKLSKYCKFNEIDDIKIIGAPKTIDNDLVGTDHSPGFGSAAKYVATTILELEKDCSVYNKPSVTIVEIMGRNSGWLTGASALPRINGYNGPQLIYLCEVYLDKDRFLFDVRKELEKNKPIIIAVSEGLKNKKGEYLGQIIEEKNDKFGHANTSGVGRYLEKLVRENIRCKVRSIELSLMQRCSGHISSRTDIEESKMLGEEALKLALKNKTGKMVGIKRISNCPYQIEVINLDVSMVANLEKKVPFEWISESENNVTEEFINYIKPLILGEIKLNYENGMPKYLRLEQ